MIVVETWLKDWSVMTDVDSTVMTDGDSTVLTVENGILFVCKIKLICAFACRCCYHPHQFVVSYLLCPC